MSYEYKDIFIESLSNFIYPGKIFDDSLSELDHVYAQAAKADEYEAKAKAWDSLKNNLEKKVEFLTNKVSGFPYVDASIESTIGYFEHVLEMMKNYESGGYDA